MSGSMFRPTRRACRSERWLRSQQKEAYPMKEFLLRRMAIIVAVMVVVGGTGIATDAFAAHGGGGGGAFAGGHFGEMGGRHFGGAVRARQFGGRAVHRRFSRVWGDGYYDGSGYYDGGYYDPLIRQPSRPTKSPPIRPTLTPTRRGVWVAARKPTRFRRKAAARLPSKWFAAEGWCLCPAGLLRAACAAL